MRYFLPGLFWIAWLTPLALYRDVVITLSLNHSIISTELKYLGWIWMIWGLLVSLTWVAILWALDRHKRIDYLENRLESTQETLDHIQARKAQDFHQANSNPFHARIRK